MFTILVTGAHGQVASELKNLVKLSSDIKWIFFDRQEWDISSVQKTEEILSAHQPNILIRSAAYPRLILPKRNRTCVIKSTLTQFK